MINREIVITYSTVFPSWAVPGAMLKDFVRDDYGRKIEFGTAKVERVDHIYSEGSAPQKCIVILSATLKSK